MFSFAGSKISKFNKIAFDEDVLWLDITMEYSLSMHELDGLENLEHVVLNFLVGEWVFFA